jgi:hypothetical protein
MLPILADDRNNQSNVTTLRPEDATVFLESYRNVRNDLYPKNPGPIFVDQAMVKKQGVNVGRKKRRARRVSPVSSAEEGDDELEGHEEGEDDLEEDIEEQQIVDLDSES